MSHDVFISYSTKDKDAGDAVCAVLERNGIRCWIAPRDVTPGMVWGSAIIGAIHGAKVMVLVFSGAANTSPQIEREVERAISKGIPVIPFRIEDVQPSDSLEYFISASHWLDAFTEALEQHLETLAKVVQRIIEVKQGKEGGEGRPANRQATDATATIELPTAPLAGGQPTSPIAPPAAGPQSVATDSLSSTPPAPPRRSRWPLVVAATSMIAAGVALAALYLIWESRKTSVAGSRQVGEVFRDCADCPEMVVVPTGRFMMGAAEQEKSTTDWAPPTERPVHEVRIAKPFAVGLFAVTRDEFEEFVRRTSSPVEGGCNVWDGKAETLDPKRSFRDPQLSGGPQTGDHPVVCVSLQEATKFVTWLSGKTGHNYRLLSDAEREYVTRAGTTTAFWWGPSISPDQANYWSDASYNGSPTTPGRFATLPVKFFRPNPWGLYQVHGNVTEWVADCWHPDYTGAPSDGSAWRTSAGGDCQEGTIRGGSFLNGPDLLRSAHRRSSPDMREMSVGFRVAQTLAN
jgi:formylglycine-generating enzyme required for sulfatase activity